MVPTMLPRLTATRYVTPLREGGSLPAVVEAEDGALYVMKFVGAGQGAKALLAEVIAGEIALHLGLDLPNMVLLDLNAEIGRSEADQEISDLLRASVGVNLGFRFLEGAFAYNALQTPPPNADLASAIVWFDAYVTNVDRTPRNVNMLMAEDRLWLIDHGAALYFHHTWTDAAGRSRSPFPLIKDHTLLRQATALRAADARLRPLLTDELLHAVVAQLPEPWLRFETRFDTAEAQRTAYFDFLRNRRDAADIFLEEALDAHARLL
jgi:hypothetical protein